MRLDAGVAAIAASLLIALVLATGPARSAGPCDTAPTPGDTTITLSVGSLARVALLHVPPGLRAGRRAPLVLALHGYGGSGAKMQSYSGLSRVADRDGFLVAYPSSSGLYWNFAAAPGLPDDVAFLGRLIDRLRSSWCVDRARVFATGVSNGAGMVALAACRLSAQLTAVAPVAGSYAGQPSCDPARPVSLLEIHGTADQVVPYLGVGRSHRGSVPAFVAAWARRDGCAATPARAALAPRATRLRHGGCRDGAVVEQITIAGGRHQWPGATPPDPGPAATICAACTIWSFFASLPVKM